MLVARLIESNAAGDGDEDVYDNDANDVDAADENAVDYSVLNMATLKAVLLAAGVRVAGVSTASKADLVARCAALHLPRDAQSDKEEENEESDEDTDEDEDEDAEAADDEEEYASFTVAELKDVRRRAGVSAGGNKAVLVARCVGLHAVVPAIGEVVSPAATQYNPIQAWSIVTNGPVPNWWRGPVAMHHSNVQSSPIQVGCRHDTVKLLCFIYHISLCV